MRGHDLSYTYPQALKLETLFSRHRSSLSLCTDHDHGHGHDYGHDIGHGHSLRHGHGLRHRS